MTANVLRVVLDHLSSSNDSLNFGSGNDRRRPSRLQVELKPRSERPLSADQIIEQLRPKLRAVPGLRVFPQNPPVINLGGRQARAQYQFTLQSGDTDELYANAPKLEARLRDTPGLIDVSSDLQLTNPQLNVSLDRNRIAALGLTADQVELAMASAFGSRQVSTIYAPDNAYQVILRVKPEYQMDPSALSMLYVKSARATTAASAPGAGLLPLSSVTTVNTGVGPLSVNHTGQLPSVTLSFNVVPGVALGDAVARVEEAARNVLHARSRYRPQRRHDRESDGM